MSKTTRSSEESAFEAFRAGNNKVVKSDDDRANETVVNSSKFKNEKFKKLTYLSNIRATKKFNFLTSDTNKALNYLQLAIIKAPIFQYFV